MLEGLTAFSLTQAEAPQNPALTEKNIFFHFIYLPPSNDTKIQDIATQSCEKYRLDQQSPKDLERSHI